MKMPRLKSEGRAAYHCVCRCCKQFYLLEDDADKDCLVHFMRRAAEFGGIKILTYIVLSNHLHVLAEEDPTLPPVDDRELDRRLRVLYSENAYEEIMDRWELWEKEGNFAAIEEEKARFRARMNNLSDFMKTLKQRFSRWYNAKYRSKGTQWEDRFRSTLVEGGTALRAVASYIDLNAVRAGIVTDPARYHYSGYAEACAGVEVARQGILHILEENDIEVSSWKKALGYYREWVYSRGETREKDKGVRAGFSKETVEKVLSSGGELSMPEALMCRIRYMTEAKALGGRGFVNQVFNTYRTCFSEKRETGARKVHHIAIDGLYSLRNLQKDVVTPSPGLG